MATATPLSPAPSLPTENATAPTSSARGKGAPKTEEQRKFAADLEALDTRLTEATTAFNTSFGEAGEKEAFRSRILPILQEAKLLFARQGRRDGGPTFAKWLRKNRPKIKVGKTTASKWLAEEGMQLAPTLPHLGEIRLVGGKVGRIVELPEPYGDGKRQMLVKYDGEPDQKPESVDLAPQKNTSWTRTPSITPNRMETGAGTATANW